MRRLASGGRSTAAVKAGGRVDAVTVLTVLAVFVTPWTGVKFLGLPIGDVLLTAACAAALASMAIGRRRLRIRTWTWLPTAASILILSLGVIVGSASLLTVLADTSTASSDAVFAGQGGGLLFVLRTFFATVVVFVLADSEIAARGVTGGLRLLEAFTWGTALSVVTAIYTDLSGRVLLAAGDNLAEKRAWGLAFHPNSLGQSIALAIPALFCIASLKPRGKLRAFVACGLLAVFGWGLLLADSRGALAVASLVTAVLLATAIYRATGAAWLVPLGIFLGLGLAALWPVFISGTRLADGGLLGVTESDEGRWDQLQLAWHMFAENPLWGVGLGQGTGVMVAAYLLSSGGVVLFAAFTAYIIIGFRAQWLRTSPFPRAYGSIAIATLLLMGLPNNSVNERFDYVTFAVIVCTALVLGSPRRTRDHLRSGRRSSSYRRGSTGPESRAQLSLHGARAVEPSELSSYRRRGVSDAAPRLR